MTLESLGWSDFFRQGFESKALEAGLVPARISRNSKHVYHIFCAEGKFVARVSGSFRHRANESSDYPAVGDWVAVRISPDGLEAEIRELLPRETVFSRQGVSASGTESKSFQQVVACNVNVALIVSALDGSRGFNKRRLERYLTLTRQSGAKPVIILNKIDLCDDIDEKINEAKSVAADAPIYAINALEDKGVEPLRQYLSEGSTIVMLGPSGIGKSTIINQMAGETLMKTGEVREVDLRGRHTTTWSELLVLNCGGVVIDTPGLRDVQLWSEESAIGETFKEIMEISESCRFRDCSHSGEPGCEVAIALEEGKISEDRLASYKKQKKEVSDSSRRRELGEKRKHVRPLRPRRKVQRKKR